MLGTLKIKPEWFAMIMAFSFLFLTAGSGFAVPSITWTGNNYPWDISADGSVVVGNNADGSWHAFRWTELTGPVSLGKGTGTGTPDVSDDGLRVSATVFAPDSVFATQGIWTKGLGWQYATPPIPAVIGADGACSAYGLSGDGTTVT